MTLILSDVEIQKLLDHDIIKDGDRNQVRANSYVFRLGKEVRFNSTGERKPGELGDILEINPGDSVLVHSLEFLNFEKSAVNEVYPDKLICAFLTPITTLMREGLQLLTTKIDPGYFGTPNWTIRNSSVEPVKLEIGEPIFKATLFLLSANEEIPEKSYGEREDKDFYQGKTGLVGSKRRLPVDAEKRKKICVSSKGTEFERLKQSGFPYDFIATQLQNVGDSIQIVTKDFARMDEKVEKRNQELSQKMDRIKESISKVADDKAQAMLGQVDDMVVRKLTSSGVMVFTIFCAMVGGAAYLIEKNHIDLIAPGGGILAVLGLVAFFLFQYFRGGKK